VAQPRTFGAAFGPSDRDLATVTSWLANHNFTGIQVNAARTFIESAARGQWSAPLSAPACTATLSGRQHFANASDPAVPAALAPVVAGIASLNNFPRRAAATGSATSGTIPSPTGQRGSKDQAQSARPKPQGLPSPSRGWNLSTASTPYELRRHLYILPSGTPPLRSTAPARPSPSSARPTSILPTSSTSQALQPPARNTATPTGTQYLNIILQRPPTRRSPATKAKPTIDTQWSSAVAKGATIDYVRLPGHRGHAGH